MMKRRMFKIAGVAAASAVLLVSTYGCSVMKAVYSDMESAVQAAENRETSVEAGNMHPVDAAYEEAATGAFAQAESAVEDAGIFPNIAEAVEEGGLWGRSATTSYTDDFLKDYEDFGVRFEPANGYWWFEGKPVTAVYDKNHHTMTDGYMMEVGAMLLVTRDDKDKITDVAAVDKTAFGEKAGLTISGSLEQDARDMKYEYHEEDISVGGMDRKQFNDTVNGLAAKYRHKDAVVKLNDYVLWFNRDDMLHLSSFCYSDRNVYGVKVYADYDVADEIDVDKLDSAEVDKLLLDMLSDNTYENIREVENAAKKVVATHYGVSEKNLSAIASLV